MLPFRLIDKFVVSVLENNLFFNLVSTDTYLVQCLVHWWKNTTIVSFSHGLASKTADRLTDMLCWIHFSSVTRNPRKSYLDHFVFVVTTSVCGNDYCVFCWSVKTSCLDVHLRHHSLRRCAPCSVFNDVLMYSLRR